MNLFLAILWLLGGVALIAWHHYTGETTWRLRIGGMPLSPGWLMLLLSAYNLIRWWSNRAIHAERRRFDLALADRRSQHFRDRPATERTIDPTFDFTSDPAPRHNYTDRPPSVN